MKQSELLFRLKLQVPNVKESGMVDSEVVSLLNQGVDQVNLLAKVYKGYTDINIVANQQAYQLSSVAPTFLGTDDKPVYFLDSDSNWQKVYPKTKEWINKVYPNWLNAAAVAIPQWYWIEGDELGFYPKPSTSQASGARLFHLKKSTGMSNNDHYPFTGSGTEITAFIPLDDAIVAYAKWKLSPAVGAVTDSDLREREFLAECRKGAMQVRRRRDINIDWTNSMTI